jgi:hypothetical protein
MVSESNYGSSLGIALKISKMSIKNCVDRIGKI